jgi:hypothetical protein
VPEAQIERAVKKVLSTATAGDAEITVTFVPAIAAKAGSHKVPLVVSELPPAA